MHTFWPRSIRTRRLAVSTLSPVTVASMSTPENPAVMVVAWELVESPVVVEVVAVATVVAAAPWSPSSPPQPATRQPATGPTTSQRTRVDRGSSVVGR
jgi:hypothetical protein